MEAASEAHQAVNQDALDGEQASEEVQQMQDADEEEDSPVIPDDSYYQSRKSRESQRPLRLPIVTTSPILEQQESHTSTSTNGFGVPPSTPERRTMNKGLGLQTPSDAATPPFYTPPSTVSTTPELVQGVTLSPSLDRELSSIVTTSPTLALHNPSTPSRPPRPEATTSRQAKSAPNTPARSSLTNGISNRRPSSTPPLPEFLASPSKNATSAFITVSALDSNLGRKQKEDKRSSVLLGMVGLGSLSRKKSTSMTRSTSVASSSEFGKLGGLAEEGDEEDDAASSMMDDDPFRASSVNLSSAAPSMTRSKSAGSSSKFSLTPSEDQKEKPTSGKIRKAAPSASVSSGSSGGDKGKSKAEVLLGRRDSGTSPVPSFPTEKSHLSHAQVMIEEVEKFGGSSGGFLRSKEKWKPRVLMFTSFPSHTDETIYHTLHTFRPGSEWEFERLIVDERSVVRVPDEAPGRLYALKVSGTGMKGKEEGGRPWGARRWEDWIIAFSDGETLGRWMKELKGSVDSMKEGERPIEPEEMSGLKKGEILMARRGSHQSGIEPPSRTSFTSSRSSISAGPRPTEESRRRSTSLTNAPSTSSASPHLSPLSASPSPQPIHELEDEDDNGYSHPYRAPPTRRRTPDELLAVPSPLRRGSTDASFPHPTGRRDSDISSTSSGFSSIPRFPQPLLHHGNMPDTPPLSMISGSSFPSPPSREPSIQSGSAAASSLYSTKGSNRMSITSFGSSNSGGTRLSAPPLHHHPPPSLPPPTGPLPPPPPPGTMRNNTRKGSNGRPRSPHSSAPPPPPRSTFQSIPFSAPLPPPTSPPPPPPLPHPPSHTLAPRLPPPSGPPPPPPPGFPPPAPPQPNESPTTLRAKQALETLSKIKSEREQKQEWDSSISGGPGNGVSQMSIRR